MAGKGGNRHAKRMAAPKAVDVKRKGIVFMKKPKSPHKKEHAIALQTALIESVKVASDSREAGKAASQGKVLVDGRKVNANYGLGPMDVLGVAGKNYRVQPEKNVLAFKELTPASKLVKYCKVTGKTILGKDSLQVSLHDGRTLKVPVSEGSAYKNGDTLVVSIPAQKVARHLKLEKGAKCLVAWGRHSGEIAELKELLERAGSKANEAKLQSGKEEFITLKGYLFVVDENFS
jgi:ribosomal protein S4E